MATQYPGHLQGCSLISCGDHDWSIQGTQGDIGEPDDHCPFCMSEKIEILLAALSAVRANSAPNAISLSPRNRIRAFFQILEQALADVSTRENMTEACDRLRIPPPSQL